MGLSKQKQLEQQRKRDAKRKQDWRREAKLGLLDFARFGHQRWAARVSKEGGPVDVAEPDNLRAIMQQQFSRDGATGRLFVLPPQKTILHFRTWMTWFGQLEQGNKNFVPELVRMNLDAPWQLGNMFFIATIWFTPYHEAGGLLGFNKILADVCGQPGLIVPTKRHVQDVLDKLQVARAIEHGEFIDAPKDIPLR